MKNIFTPSPDAAKDTNKTSARKRNYRRMLLFVLPAALIAAAVLTAAKSPKIKNALLLRFGSPETYMAYVETNYLLAQGKEWRAMGNAFSALFEGADLSGARVDVHISQLLTSLLQKKSASGGKLDLSGLSLLFLAADKQDSSFFRIAAQTNDVPIASLDFLTDAAAKQFYIACPQAGPTALVLSTAQDDPFTMLLCHFGKLLNAFCASVCHAVSSDPYAYLLPYLDAITAVTLERGATLPASGTDLTAIRLDMALSLDTALDIAATQLGTLKNNPDVTDPLLPCYELSIRLLESIAARYPADLLITAYVDDNGNVLGHEFSILSQNETLLSLTGILMPSPAGGKSGELTFFSALENEPLTIQLSVSQIDFDLQAGLVSGKINFYCDRLPSLHFQLHFTSLNGLPKLSLLVRTLGVTAVSLELTPTDTKPEPFPDPQDYAKTYSPLELSAFLQSLDFSGIISDFYNETGICLPVFPSSLFQSADEF